jgi:hypothetical protein
VAVIVSLTWAYTAAAPRADAAVRSISLDGLATVKGFVVAKTATSMTLREGRTLVYMAVTPLTKVSGRRASFAAIAVDDVVRVEASMGPNRRLVASRLDVVFTAGPMTLVRRSTQESDDTVTLVTW